MAEIVPLHGPELEGCMIPDNAPARLRNIADEIEAGKHGAVRIGVLVLMGPDGQCAVFGVGRDGGDMLAACGALQWGQGWFQRNVLALAEQQDV